MIMITSAAISNKDARRTRIGSFQMARATANINHALIKEIPEPASSTYAAVTTSAQATGKARSPTTDRFTGSSSKSSANNRATKAPRTNAITPIMLTCRPLTTSRCSVPLSLTLRHCSAEKAALSPNTNPLTQADDSGVKPANATCFILSARPEPSRTPGATLSTCSPRVR